MDESDAGSLTSVWDRQNIWSKAANKAKADVGRARGWILGLTIAGAISSSAAAQTAGWNTVAARILGGLAAATLGLVPVLGRSDTTTLTRDWTRLRSVSEALKTEVYTYLAGVAPYRGGDRQATLLNRVREIADQPDLAQYAAGVVADKRPLPDVHDVKSFIRVRLSGQIDRYYRPKAANYRRRSDRLRRVEVALAAIGAVLAAVAAVVPRAGIGTWVGVLTTVAGAVAAHAAAQRYEYQQVEFWRTADQIEDLRSRYESTEHDEAGDDAFVAACERVISIQNDAWMAKLARTPNARSELPA